MPRYVCKVPTFSYCTKCVDSLVIIHDRTSVTQFPGHGCMDDLKTGGSFESQAAWVIDELGLFFLTRHPWVFVQPGTGRRPVAWCRYFMSVL